MERECPRDPLPADPCARLAGRDIAGRRGVFASRQAWLVLLAFVGISVAPMSSASVSVGESQAWAAKGEKKGEKKGGKKAGKKGGKKGGRKDPPVTAPVEPVTPPTPPSTATVTPPVVLPLAAIRLECNSEGGQGRLCEVVQEAAAQVASRHYQLLPPAKVEELFAKEPSLRGCRRDDCRAVIADRLAATRLVDVIVQSPKGRGLLASVSVFDPEAKGISQDTEVLLKREEAKLRRQIEEAVDLVITTQRLTAPLRLDVKPAGCKVRLIDSRGNTRDLTDAERDGTRDVRVFLGAYTVHVEKPGFLAQDASVTVAQAGGSLAVELKNQPVSVKFEWTPEGTRVLVDGEAVDPREKIIELAEGTHRVEAFAPRNLPYESTVFTINVRVGMEPVRVALQRLTEIRIAAPRGYSISVDGQLVPSKNLQVRDLRVETAVPTTPGVHMVSVRNWRGLQLRQQVTAVPRNSTDVALYPPSLVPGAVIGSLGLAAALAGGTLLIVGNTVNICTRPNCETVFNPNIPGGLLLGIGSAAFIVGASWFGWAAANHPRFHREKTADGGTKTSRMLDRPPTNLWSVRPLVSPSFAGIFSELRF
jgi:hypothetical protein